MREGVIKVISSRGSLDSSGFFYPSCRHDQASIDIVCLPGDIIGIG
jgi:hypothetical protein